MISNLRKDIFIIFSNIKKVTIFGSHFPFSLIGLLEIIKDTQINNVRIYAWNGGWISSLSLTDTRWIESLQLFKKQDYKIEVEECSGRGKLIINV